MGCSIMELLVCVVYLSIIMVVVCSVFWYCVKFNIISYVFFDVLIESVLRKDF